MSYYSREAQLESCQVCGRLRPNDEMIVSDVEGTRGLLVCLDHGRLVTDPSFRDLNISSGSFMPPFPPVREQPVGAPIAGTMYAAPVDFLFGRESGVGVVLRESGDYLLREPSYEAQV